jgi:hypothetical protein
MSASRPTRSERLGRRVARTAGASACVALAGYHALLLAARLSDFSIAEPEVAARWAGALALAALAWALRRRGLAIASGRTGLALSTLVLVLHLGAPPLSPDARPGDALAAALPLGLAPPLVAALAVARLTRRRPAPPRLRVERARRPETPAWHLLAPALALRFEPRPPPAA